MDSSGRIALLRKRIDEEIGLLFKHKQPEGLYEPMEYLLRAGGKRIRPLLVILSCQAVGGKLVDCLDAALGMELIHTFTLVHDDIMDHDNLRRGRPTVHRQWDEPTAILAGDGLVTLAFQTLLRSHHPRILEVLRKFSDGLLVLCEGQALDKKFEVSEDVSIEAYECMIWKKTAKLMEVACESGAILGNGKDEEVSALGRFAGFLGKAFQIQDDLLDLLSDEEVSGKPMGSDLMEKKKTFLTISFLNNASLSEKERFLSLWSKVSVKDGDVLQIRDLFEQSGVFRLAQDRVDAYISSALKSMNSSWRGHAREDLENLVRQIRVRCS